MEGGILCSPLVRCTSPGHHPRVSDRHVYITGVKTKDMVNIYTIQCCGSGAFFTLAPGYVFSGYQIPNIPSLYF
jgi:hypothetical protein